MNLVRPIRYCARITRSHYHELRSKSTPFVCMVCIQRSQRAIIKQLQDKVSSLRSELDKLRKADSLESSATPETNKAALDALKDDVQQLKSCIHGYSTQKRHAKPSYAKMAAASNSLMDPNLCYMRMTSSFTGLSIFQMTLLCCSTMLIPWVHGVPSNY